MQCEDTVGAHLIARMHKLSLSCSHAPMHTHSHTHSHTHCHTHAGSPSRGRRSPLLAALLCSSRVSKGSHLSRCKRNPSSSRAGHSRRGRQHTPHLRPQASPHDTRKLSEQGSVLGRAGWGGEQPEEEGAHSGGQLAGGAEGEVGRAAQQGPNSAAGATAFIHEFTKVPGSGVLTNLLESLII